MSRQASLDHNAKIAWDRIHQGIGTTIRISSALLKTILLKYGDSSFFEGQTAILSKRSLGAGVYEISLKRPILK